MYCWDALSLFTIFTYIFTCKAIVKVVLSWLSIHSSYIDGKPGALSVFYQYWSLALEVLKSLKTKEMLCFVNALGML